MQMRCVKFKQSGLFFCIIISVKISREFENKEDWKNYLSL